MNCFPDSFDDRDYVGFGRKMGDSKESLQLLKPYHDGCSSHKSNYWSMG